MVDHQVNLQVARWRRIPIGEGPLGEGPHRYIAGQRLLPPSSEPAGRRCPDGLEQSVQGGGAGRQQSLAHPRVQIQVAMALHGLHQPGGATPPSAACRRSGQQLPKPRSTPHQLQRRRCVGSFLPRAAAPNRCRTGVCPSNLMPCLRWWPVTAMNSSRIRLFSRFDEAGSGLGSSPAIPVLPSC